MHRFVMLPFEVCDLLDSVSMSAERLYRSLLRRHYVSEDQDSGGQWVVGTIRTSKIDIVNLSGVSRGAFWHGGWEALIDAGLVIDNEDGTITLPMLRRHKDTPITAAGVMEIEQRLDRVETVVFDPAIAEKEADDSLKRADQSLKRANEALNEAPAISDILSSGSRKKDQDPVLLPPSGSLGDPQKVRQSDKKGGGILNSQEKEKQSLIEELSQRGVYDEEAAKLVEEYGSARIKENIRAYDSEKMRSVRMAGGALVWRIQRDHAGKQARRAADRRKKREESEEAKRREDQARKEKEQAEEEKEQGKAAEIAAYKDLLDTEEREQLRKEAQAEIAADGEFKDEFISDILIEIKESEIIYKQLHPEKEQVLESNT